MKNDACIQCMQLALIDHVWLAICFVLYTTFELPVGRNDEIRLSQLVNNY